MVEGQSEGSETNHNKCNRLRCRCPPRSYVGKIAISVQLDEDNMIVGKTKGD
jgi:hypothetical protein